MRRPIAGRLDLSHLVSAGDQAYFQKHGIEVALAEMVALLAASRPVDPYRAIAEFAHRRSPGVLVGTTPVDREKSEIESSKEALQTKDGCEAALNRIDRRIVAGRVMVAVEAPRPDAASAVVQKDDPEFADSPLMPRLVVDNAEEWRTQADFAYSPRDGLPLSGITHAVDASEGMAGRPLAKSLLCTEPDAICLAGEDTFQLPSLLSAIAAGDMTAIERLLNDRCEWLESL